MSYYALIYNPYTSDYVKFEFENKFVHLEYLLYSGVVYIANMKNKNVNITDIYDMVNFLSKYDYTGIKVYNCVIVTEETNYPKVPQEILDFFTYIEMYNSSVNQEFSIFNEISYNDDLLKFLGNNVKHLTLSMYNISLNDKFWRKLQTLPLKTLHIDDVRKIKNLEINEPIVYHIFSSVDDLGLSDKLVRFFKNYVSIFELMLTRNIKVFSVYKCNTRLLSMQHIIKEI